MLISIKKLKLFFAFSLIASMFGCGDVGNYNPNTGSGGTNMTSVTLTWDPPTTNTNGTALTQLAGYKLYMGTTPGKLTLLSDVGNTNTYTVTGLQAGSTLYFGVTAYDSQGSESDISNLITG